MKKVGIITYHFARNYGAVLQCYALQSFLEKKNYEVEIINYISQNQYDNNDYYKHGKSIKKIIANILLFPFFSLRKKKNKKFDDFNKKYLKLTNRVHNINELKNLVNIKKYDYIISGSDQVFNPNIEDFDYAFLLPFKTDTKKISYAASTGNATKDDINNILKYIKDFSKISIREEKDLFKFEDSKFDISIVPDPVMLLKKEDWVSIDDNVHEKDYLLCYFLHKKFFKKEFLIAKKIAKEKNLKIKIINARYSIYSFKKGTIYDAGPVEFINYIKNSKYVCTDSFHGTLFSIIFGKEFKCFDSISNKTDSRRKNLLELLDANEAFQFVEKEFEDSLINYKRVNKNLNNQIKKAEVFIGGFDEK